MSCGGGDRIFRRFGSGGGPYSISSTKTFHGEPNGAYVETVILSSSVPAGKKWLPISIQFDCTFQGTLRVLGGGSLIGSGQTHPGSPMGLLKWDVEEPINGGSLLELKWRQEDGPIVPIRYHVQLLEIIT